MSYVLRRIPGRYAVVRLAATEALPAWLSWTSPFISVTRAADELSVIVEEQHVPAALPAERGFAAYRVDGPLPFNVVGVMAALSSALASAGVSLLAVSTHDTDVLLVREADATRAERAWMNTGQRVA
jgi:hypothetical protein